MFGGRPLTLMLAALMLASSSALAAQSEMQLTSALPVTVEGDRVVAADDGDFLLQGDAGQVSLLIEGEAGTLTRVVHRAYGIINQEDPQAGVLWEQKVEQEELSLDGAFITLQHRDPEFTLLLHDGPMRIHDGAADTPLHVGVLGTPKAVESTAEHPIQLVLGKSDSKPFMHILRAGLYESRSLDGRITSDGNLQAFVSDGVLQYHGADGSSSILRANFREETHPGAVFDPVEGRWTGPGDHTEYVHEYITLDLAAAKVQLQHRDLPATLFAKTPYVETTGTAHFLDATGMIRVHNEDATTTHTFQNDDVDVTGRFGFALAGTSSGNTRTHVTGEGDVVGVTYRATTHEYDWAVVAVATGIGALLLGIAAWIGGAGKWILGGAGTLVAGYARVQGDAVLQHDGRQQVYDLVQAEPGMHFMDLCERLPFGASTLNYHLRVLERNEFVTRVKDGRYVRFFDRRSGAFAGERKTAVSALRNNTTAAIADCIVQNPGIAQRDLAEAFGIAASTVSWHVERLQRSGLVEKQRDSHFTRYYMGRAWTNLPHDELARFGIAG